MFQITQVRRVYHRDVYQVLYIITILVAAGMISMLNKCIEFYYLSNQRQRD